MPRTLTVLYDASCGLCRRARSWLMRQEQYISLEFIAAASHQAIDRYPDLDPMKTLETIHVIDDQGNVYRNEKAWLILLWALADYRKWSLHFSEPHRIYQAKRLVEAVSKGRKFSIGGRNVS